MGNLAGKSVVGDDFTGARVCVTEQAQTQQSDLFGLNTEKGPCVFPDAVPRQQH